MNRHFFIVLPILLLINSNFAHADQHSELDSLYRRFEDKQKKAYVEEANKIMQVMGDDYSFPAEVSFQEASSILLDKYVDYFRMKGDYKGRLSYLNKALSLYAEQDDSMNVARTYHSLGATYQILGLYDRAIESYNSSSDILNAIGGDNSQLRYRYTLNNIAALFFEQNDFDKCEELYHKCLSLINDMEDETRNQVDRSTYLGNLAMVYNAKAESSDDSEKITDYLNTAREYAYEAVTLAKKYCDGTDNEIEIVKRAITLARTMMLQNQLQDAERVLRECDDYIERNSLDYQRIQVVGIRAEIEERKGNAFAAERLYNEVYEYTRKNGLKEMEGQVLENLYSLLKEKNPAKALECFEKRAAIRDSIFTLKQNVLISDFEVQYETQEKENLIQKQIVSIRHGKTVAWLLALILLLCAWFAISKYRHVLIVRKQNKELSESNATKDKMISIISHDLKNPAFAQRNALRGLYSSYSALDNNTIGTYINELLKSSETQVQLVSNLLDWARLQTGKLSCNMSENSLSSIINNELRTINMMKENKNIDIVTDLSPEDDVFADRNMISIVVRNLITNAIKFSNPGGTIEIKTGIEDNKAFCTISDHGVGIEQSALNKLFEEGSTAYTKGTADESGTGLGLELCKSFLKMNNGSISADSKLGEGTAFKFYLNRA